MTCISGRRKLIRVELPHLPQTQSVSVAGRQFFVRTPYRRIDIHLASVRPGREPDNRCCGHSYRPATDNYADGRIHRAVPAVNRKTPGYRSYRTACFRILRPDQVCGFSDCRRRKWIDSRSSLCGIENDFSETPSCLRGCVDQQGYKRFSQAALLSVLVIFSYTGSTRTLTLRLWVVLSTSA